MGLSFTDFMDRAYSLSRPLWAVILQGSFRRERSIPSPAHPCARGIPYILYIKSSGSNMM
jgi:hypothetical protein